MELLELTLSPVNARRFLAIASRVPNGVGDASTEGDLPFWTEGQDWRRTIIKILESSQGFRSDNFPEVGEQDWLEQERLLLPGQQYFDSAYLQRIGQALYQSLFPPDSALKQILQQCLRLAEQRNTDLHLRLKFAADSGQRSRLADYPWELLHDGQRFLLHHRVRLSRYIAYEAPPPQLPAQEKVRVLLISARPQGLAQLTQAEQQAIQVGLERAQNAGLVQSQALPSPTRKALNRYLTDCSSQEMPQVLHFDGHGVFGKRCTNPGCLTVHPGIKAEICSVCGQRLPEPQGYLAFESEQGKPDWQSATQVAAILQPHSIALVVLSACQSGMAVAGDSVFNGMAQNLIDQRIPAVVAMQYSVRADAACDFAEQFYRVLGKKEPLLKALNQGIREMDVEGNQWYRPVLYLRWQDNEGGQLFANVSAQTSPAIAVADLETKHGSPTPNLLHNSNVEQAVSLLSLTVEQRKELRAALISAFPRQADLELMIEDELGESFNLITQGQPNYELAVRDLVKWAETKGKVQPLLEGALQSNPGNPKLQEIAKLWLKK